MQELRWGYTVHDVNKIADQAAYHATKRGGHLVPQAVRADMARDFITEAIYERGRFTRPSEQFLLNRAVMRVENSARSEARKAGTLVSSRAARMIDPEGHEPTDLVDEGLAVRQVMAALPEPARKLLIHLVDHDGNVAALARTLGEPKTTVHRDVERARMAFKARWFGDESPPAGDARLASHKMAGTYS